MYEMKLSRPACYINKELFLQTFVYLCILYIVKFISLVAWFIFMNPSNQLAIHVCVQNNWPILLFLASSYVATKLKSSYSNCINSYVPGIAKKGLIKTDDSESWGQAVSIIHKTKIMWPMSELFTRKSAKKLTYDLANLP